MHPVLITLTLLVTTTAFAQTPKTEQEARAQLELIERNACPVGIFARHEGSPAAVWTVSQEDLHPDKPVPAKNKSGPGLHVDLNAPQKEIKQADLVVFFLPPGARRLPVAGSQFAPSSAGLAETSKKFSLTPGSPSHRLGGDLLLGPVASITHVSLMHITYSDGSEWNAPNANTCSREPSKYMPVDAK